MGVQLCDDCQVELNASPAVLLAIKTVESAVLELVYAEKRDLPYSVYIETLGEARTNLRKVVAEWIFLKRVQLPIQIQPAMPTKEEMTAEEIEEMGKPEKVEDDELKELLGALKPKEEQITKKVAAAPWPEKMTKKIDQELVDLLAWPNFEEKATGRMNPDGTPVISQVTGPAELGVRKLTI
jgi:hypothetical protein